MFSSFQVVLPTFNEEGRIENTLRHFVSLCKKVLVIDNFSTDATRNLIENLFPSVEVQLVRNRGTSETPDWWISVSPYISAEYVVFGSCSENIPREILELYEKVADSNIGEIISVPRRTFTGKYPTDSLFGHPSSLLSLHDKPSHVVRMVRWSSIAPSLIYPHDSFRSQKHCKRLILDFPDKSLCIHHYRPFPGMNTYRKHSSYAKCYAEYHCHNSFAVALFDSTSRAILDGMRMVRAIILKRCNKAVACEFMLRMVMHSQVVLYAAMAKRVPAPVSK